MSESNGAMQPIAIYHEHPDWFKPLFAELDRRAAAVRAARRRGARLRSVGGRRARTRSSSTARARRRICAATASRRSTRCTGCATSSASAFRSSTARRSTHSSSRRRSQLEILLEELGTAVSASRARSTTRRWRRRPRDGLRYPGAREGEHRRQRRGHRSLRDRGARSQGAIARGEVELGIDGVALVQESAPLRDGHIVSRRDAGRQVPLRHQGVSGGRLVRPLPGRRLPDDGRRRARARRLRGRRAEDGTARRRLHAAAGDHRAGRSDLAPRGPRHRRHRVSRR